MTGSIAADARRRAFTALSDSSLDVLVIGGGIVGCGALLDATSRGLTAALVERDDLAVGTSSRSSRLIHGGLRYLEQYRFGQREGLRAIRDRQPWWLAEKLYEQMPMFWEAESMAVIHVKRGAYGPVRPPAAVAVAVVMLAPYLAVLAFFVPGLARLTWERRILLLVAFLGYYNLIHVATHGFNRYRMPVMPIVFLFAAAAFVAWRERRLALDRTRRLVAVALALLFAITLVPSFRVHWEHPAFAIGHPGETPEAP